jgi:hypothetical protein
LQDNLVQCRDHVFTDKHRKHSRGGDYITDDPVIPTRNENQVYLLPTPLFVTSSSHTADTTTPENFYFAQLRASPHVMSMVANMEQGQPQPRHFNGNDMSIAKDEISDEFQVPRDARRNKVFERDESVGDDTSDISGRSRKRNLNEHKVEKDILIKSLQVKGSQRKYEEEQIQL